MVETMTITYRISYGDYAPRPTDSQLNLTDARLLGNASQKSKSGVCSPNNVKTKTPLQTYTLVQLQRRGSHVNTTMVSEEARCNMNNLH